MASHQVNIQWPRVISNLALMINVLMIVLVYWALFQLNFISDWDKLIFIPVDKLIDLIDKYSKNEHGYYYPLRIAQKTIIQMVVKGYKKIDEKIDEKNKNKIKRARRKLRSQLALQLVIFCVIFCILSLEKYAPIHNQRFCLSKQNFYFL